MGCIPSDHHLRHRVDVEDLSVHPPGRKRAVIVVGDPPHRSVAPPLQHPIAGLGEHCRRDTRDPITLGRPWRGRTIGGADWNRASNARTRRSVVPPEQYFKEPSCNLESVGE